MNAVRALISRSARLAALTGAGISAESRIQTFRAAGGLWRNFKAEDLATPGGTITATGKRLEQFPVAFVYVVDGGKFKEVHLYFDLISLLQQIGARPQGEV